MVSLYDAKAIKAEIKELLDEAQAISALATEEKREPTEDESARFNEIMDLVGDDDAEGGPTGLRAKLATAAKFERIKSQNAASDLGAPRSAAPMVHGTGAEPFAVPRAAIARARNLKAFARGTSENHLHDGYATGKWLYAILGDESSRNWCEDNGYGIRAAQKESDNSLGGFFVPVEMASRIIDLRYQYGVFRRFADVEPMASDTKTVPRRKSGVTAYAIGEGNSFTESDIDFTQVSLVARKWGALVKMSDELDEDAVINFAERVVGEMAWAFAKKEDESGFLGDGTNTYHGINGIVNKANDGSHAGALHTAESGNTAFSTLDLLDFENMAGKLPSWAEDGAAWYIHKVGWAASMARLQMAAGGNTTTDIGNGPEMSFLGYPVRFTPVMNSTTAAQSGTAGLAILANLQLCSTVGDRSGFSLKVLNELYAENGQIGLRGHTRSDINNHSITDPEDQTGATAGAAVVLKTP